MRIRSKRHLAFVASKLCAVHSCGRPAQVHHLLKGSEPKARGLKVGDNWTAPLCVYHHAELHNMGDERKFAERYGIDLVEIAASLWRRSPAYRDTNAQEEENEHSGDR